MIEGRVADGRAGLGFFSRLPIFSRRLFRCVGTGPRSRSHGGPGRTGERHADPTVPAWGSCPRFLPDLVYQRHMQRPPRECAAQIGILEKQDQVLAAVGCRAVVVRRKDGSDQRRAIVDREAAFEHDDRYLFLLDLAPEDLRREMVGWFAARRKRQ